MVATATGSIPGVWTYIRDKRTCGPKNGRFHVLRIQGFRLVAVGLSSPMARAVSSMEEGAHYEAVRSGNRKFAGNRRSRAPRVAGSRRARFLYARLSETVRRRPLDHANRVRWHGCAIARYHGRDCDVCRADRGTRLDSWSADGDFCGIAFD